MIRNPHALLAWAPKTRSLHTSPPLRLWLRLHTGQGARGRGCWLVAGFSPHRRDKSAQGQEHPGTRAPGVRGKLRSAGVELVPPYASLQDQRGGKDRPSPGWSPQPTPGVRSNLIRTRSLKTLLLGKAEETQMRSSRPWERGRGSRTGSLWTHPRQRWRGKVCAPPPMAGGASEPQGLSGQSPGVWKVGTHKRLRKGGRSDSGTRQGASSRHR